MERPSRPAATAREIILEIVRNMREGLEPLHYSTLPPSIYQVYLHPDDLERLRGIVPRIVEEAHRALDAELESLNRASLGERLKIARRDLPKASAPEGGWQITIHENTDDDVEPGDIVVNSELALPVKTEFGAGSMTKRIATRRMASAAAGTQTAARTSYQPAAEPASGEASAFATIEYEDRGGRKTFSITKNQIVVGRGGRDYWTDLKLDTLPDVSREHFRLRRDPESGRFFLKDLSRLGTTIDGQPVPSSIEVVEGEKRDRNLETPVPDRARIGLADVLFLEFRNAARPEPAGSTPAREG
ncbi:MAG: FHA domain-containing protein [Bryobacteraceae bacterium]